MSSGPFFRRPAVLLALCLVSVGAVVTLLGRLANGPQLQQKRSALSTEAGTKVYPAFSPDGAKVAYSARGTSKDAAYHIFIRTVGGGPVEQLTSGAGNDTGPAWSPNGASIAFLRVEGAAAECMVIPSAGGAPRKIAECGMAGPATQPFPAVAWTRDGKSLVAVGAGEKPALAVVAVASGAAKALTRVPEGVEGDTMPAVSPDGGTVAFVRNTSSGGADLWLADLAGAAPPRRLTFDDRGIRGVTWTPDGHDLIYSSDRARGWGLWRIAAYGGSPRDLTIGGGAAQYPAVAPGGYRLAYTESPSVSSIWRAALPGGASSAASGVATEEQAIIRSTGRESQPVYSPDGKRIADLSDQTGTDEIWVCDADGGNRVQVTKLNGMRVGRLRWSPDSKVLLYSASADRGEDLYTVPAEANGKVRRILLGSGNASWSNDGKWIYFTQRDEIWKATADGGDPQPLTKQPGSRQPVESVDGKWVYFRRQRTILRVPAAGGDEEEAFIPEHDLVWTTTIQAAKKGIYYLELERSTRSWVVSLYDFSSKKSTVAFRMRDADWQAASFSVSPDGKFILYPRVDQSETNLMLVESFR